MKELRDWIAEFKTENAELNGFVAKLEGFISDAGFNMSKFENAVNQGLKNKEEEIRKTFTEDIEN